MAEALQRYFPPFLPQQIAHLLQLVQQELPFRLYREMPHIQKMDSFLMLPELYTRLHPHFLKIQLTSWCN